MTGFRKELRPMVRLAAPLALAELGWMAMGFVDTIMAGRIDAVSIGAGGVGSMLFFPIVVAATGLLLGMDTLVSHAFGAKRDDDCRHTLISGLWLALFISPFTVAIFLATIPLLRAFNTNAEVMAVLVPYLQALSWGAPALIFYTAFRRYLQARDIVRPITFAVVSANLINFGVNWLLMYGNWGAPRLEMLGSGISTALSRIYIGAVLGIALLLDEKRHGWRLFQLSWRPDWTRIGGLLRLGTPTAVQIGVEGAVFGAVTVMAAKLDAVSLAAHAIAINVISITFMVPLGISSAAAVRVGQALGRRDPNGSAVAGWTALALSAAFMGCAGVVLFAAPDAVARLYTKDAAVIAVSGSLLWIAAFFQLFDGSQVVATGAMRGLGDTRTPAIVHFAGYWLIGMPIAYLLCFRYGWGARGIWVGLTVALVLIGAVLLAAWRRALLRQK